MDNRNLYGFVVFIFIVKATILLNYVLFAPTVTYNISPPPEVYTASEHYKCDSWEKKPNLENNQNQATLDLQLGKLSLDMNLNQIGYRCGNGAKITLDFYTKDAQTRKIGTEKITLDDEDVYYQQREGNTIVKGLIEKNCSRSWVRKLKENQSLYVVARLGHDDLSGKFDEAEAIPVLLFAEQQ